ncbi:MAG: penicillin-binding transpeptidase domain-containing protein [Nannocystaceae bacterium]
MSAARKRFGGVGALFFLATLGVISFYVQRQSHSDAHEGLRKPATALPTPDEVEKPPPLPWKDRLDLAAITLATVETAPLPAELPGVATGHASNVNKREVAPESALYVQELNDGHRLLYTLDPVLQQSLLQIFRNREVPYAGAVVVDLRDNAVLALAGHSSLDAEVDPLEVVTTAWAPAASTFKLVTAASLLENGFATPKSKICYHDGLRGITDDLLRDDPRRDSRCNTLRTAISRSLNLVLAKLALKHLDERHLTDTAKAFQYETEIPFEFRVETSPAHIPADARARAKVAAGFWHVDLSPVHGALIASIFARGGIYQPPHLLAHILGPDGSDLTPGPVSTRRVLSRDTADSVGSMMVATTVEGTARSSFFDRKGRPYVVAAKVAGKTGSLSGKRPPALNYNWFLGFAPAQQPEIAFAVVLANEPKWRIKAHYVGRRIVQLYMARRDAITEHRSARLTDDGVMLPRRDPETGAIVSKANPVAGDRGAAHTPASPSGPPPAQSDPAADHLDALPDPAHTLPPVPGPLPNPRPPSDSSTPTPTETPLR